MIADFCESFAKLLCEENRYAEVFPMVYKDSQKFADLFNKNRRKPSAICVGAYAAWQTKETGD